MKQNHLSSSVIQSETNREHWDNGVWSKPVLELFSTDKFIIQSISVQLTVQNTAQPSTVRWYLKNTTGCAEGFLNNVVFLCGKLRTELVFGE